MMGKIDRLIAACLGVALVAGGALVLTAEPAGAVDVVDEAGFQAALANDDRIELTQDIDLTCEGTGGQGDLLRFDPDALEIDGNGFTLTQTCTGERVIEQTGTGALTFADITITGGNCACTGAGISSAGAVTLDRATVSGNQNTGGGTQGGGVLGSSVTAIDSSISGNISGVGAGLSASGAGLVTVTRSTVSGNVATNGGGGVFTTGDVIATNSSFVGNVAGEGGAIQADDDVTLTHTTFAENAANDTIGLHGAHVTLGDTLTTVGSVFSDAIGAQAANCGFGTSTVSGGYNYEEGDDSCDLGAGAGDVENGADALLGPLGANGGPTQTTVPQATSPLIDAIPNGACVAGVTTDQRGFARPGVTGGSCDIGAVEVQPPPPSTTPPTVPPCPVTAQSSIAGGTLLGAEWLVVALLLGVYAWTRRRGTRMHPLLVSLLLAGVSVAVLAACQPAKPPPIC